MDLSNNFYGWSEYMTPDPAPNSQYRSSVLVDDGTYTHIKPFTHGPPGYHYLPFNGLPDGPHPGHVDFDPINATTGFSGSASSPLYYFPDYQGHPEGVGLASSPSPFRPTIYGCGPLPTEGSSTHTSYLPVLPPPSPHRVSELDHLLSQTSPIRSAEIHVNTNISFEPAPLQDVPPSIPAGAIPQMMPHRNSGYIYAFPSTEATRGSMQYDYAETTSLGTRSKYSTSSSQPPATSTSSAINPDRPSNHYSPPDPYSGHGNRPALTGTHSAGKGRPHTATVSPGASSWVSAGRRKPKKYWCKVPGCIAGFSQKQGLQRHSKDTHFPRETCPYCKDFEWSSGRKYTFTKHLEEKHSGVALPKMALRFQRQDPRRA